MLDINGFFGRIYNIGDWLGKLIYLHFLWILFTVAGLGIFGVFPATAAVYSQMYQWIKEGTDMPIFKSFYEVYKQNFLKSNGLGIILISAFAFLYIDIRISRQFIQSYPVHYFLLTLGFILLVISIYLFTIFNRYDLSVLQHFKQAFLIAVASPFETIAMILSLIILIYIFSHLPVLLFLMGTSMIIFPLVWFGYRACLKVEEQSSKYNENQSL